MNIFLLQGPLYLACFPLNTYFNFHINEMMSQSERKERTKNVFFIPARIELAVISGRCFFLKTSGGNSASSGRASLARQKGHATLPMSDRAWGTRHLSRGWSSMMKSAFARYDIGDLWWHNSRASNDMDINQCHPSKLNKTCKNDMEAGPERMFSLSFHSIGENVSAWCWGAFKHLSDDWNLPSAPSYWLAIAAGI